MDYEHYKTIVKMSDSDKQENRVSNMSKTEDISKGGTTSKENETAMMGDSDLDASRSGDQPEVARQAEKMSIKDSSKLTQDMLLLVCDGGQMLYFHPSKGNVYSIVSMENEQVYFKCAYRSVGIERHMLSCKTKKVRKSVKWNCHPSQADHGHEPVTREAICHDIYRWLLKCYKHQHPYWTDEEINMKVLDNWRFVVSKRNPRSMIKQMGQTLKKIKRNKLGNYKKEENEMRYGHESQEKAMQLLKTVLDEERQLKYWKPIKPVDQRPYKEWPSEVFCCMEEARPSRKGTSTVLGPIPVQGSSSNRNVRQRSPPNKQVASVSNTLDVSDSEGDTPRRKRVGRPAVVEASFIADLPEENLNLNRPTTPDFITKFVKSHMKIFERMAHDILSTRDQQDVEIELRSHDDQVSDKVRSRSPSKSASSESEPGTSRRLSPTLLDPPRSLTPKTSVQTPSRSHPQSPQVSDDEYQSLSSSLMETVIDDGERFPSNSPTNSPGDDEHRPRQNSSVASPPSSPVIGRNRSKKAGLPNLSNINNNNSSADVSDCYGEPPTLPPNRPICPNLGDVTAESETLPSPPSSANCSMDYELNSNDSLSPLPPLPDSDSFDSGTPPRLALHNRSVEESPALNKAQKVSATNDPTKPSVAASGTGRVIIHEPDFLRKNKYLPKENEESRFNAYRSLHPTQNVTCIMSNNTIEQRTLETDAFRNFYVEHLPESSQVMPVISQPECNPESGVTCGILAGTYKEVDEGLKVAGPELLKEKPRVQQQSNEDDNRKIFIFDRSASYSNSSQVTETHNFNEESVASAECGTSASEYEPTLSKQPQLEPECTSQPPADEGDRRSSCRSDSDNYQVVDQNLDPGNVKMKLIRAAGPVLR